MLGKFLHKFTSLAKIGGFDNKLQIVVSHLFYPKGKILYVWKNRPIIVDGSRAETSGGIHAVLGTTEYTQFLEKIDKPGVRNLMDLGANVGSFSILAHEWFPNLRRAIVVEADESVLPRLQFNVFETLTRSKAEIVHSAVCGHDGEIEFYQNPSSVGSSTNAGVTGASAVRTTVPAISLSSLLRLLPDGEMVDLCKMDIEGSEFPAFQALVDDELRRFRFIVMELHGTAEENEAFIARLVGKGYRHHACRHHANSSTHAFQRDQDTPSSRLPES